MPITVILRGKKEKKVFTSKNYLNNESFQIRIYLTVWKKYDEGSNTKPIKNRHVTESKQSQKWTFILMTHKTGKLKSTVKELMQKGRGREGGLGGQGGNCVRERLGVGRMLDPAPWRPLHSPTVDETALADT